LQFLADWYIFFLGGFRTPKESLVPHGSGLFAFPRNGDAMNRDDQPADNTSGTGSGRCNLKIRNSIPR